MSQTPESCQTCKYFEKVVKRGQRYPRGNCLKHRAIRKSDGYVINLHICGFDEFWCDSYVPNPVIYMVEYGATFSEIPANAARDLLSYGWREREIIEKDKRVTIIYKDGSDGE